MSYEIKFFTFVPKALYLPGSIKDPANKYVREFHSPRFILAVCVDEDKSFAYWKLYCKDSNGVMQFIVKGSTGAIGSVSIHHEDSKLFEFDYSLHDDPIVNNSYIGLLLTFINDVIFDHVLDSEYGFDDKIYELSTEAIAEQLANLYYVVSSNIPEDKPKYDYEKDGKKFLDDYTWCCDTDDIEEKVKQVLNMVGKL